MRWHRIHVHHRAVGEKRHLVDSGHRGDGCASADINKDAFGRQILIADLNFPGAAESSVAGIDLAVGQAAQPLFDADP